MRNIFLSVLFAALVFATPARAAVTYDTLADLIAAVPSPDPGYLAWILDGNGTTTPGEDCSGSGVPGDGNHMCTWDGSAWVFVQEGAPVAPPSADPETFLDAFQVRFDPAISGLSAIQVQDALDEIQASAGGPIWTVVGSLPGTPSNTTQTYVVIDGNALDDCSVGAGSLNVHCSWDGLSWQSLGGGAGGVVGASAENSFTGILTGGVVTINGDTTKFDVAAGTGIVVDWTTPGTPVLTEVSWNALTAVTPAGLATDLFTNLAINASGALVQRAGGGTGPAERRQEIILQSVIHSNLTIIDDVAGDSTPAYEVSKAIIDYINALGPVNVGNSFGANGANLNVNKSAGITTLPFINRGNDPQNPSNKTDDPQTPATLFLSYRDGSGGFTVVPSVSAVDPNFYDDGSGTLVAVANNKWQVQRFHFISQNQSVLLEYGQDTYTARTDALNAVQAETFAENPFASSGTFTTALIVQEGATDLNDSATAEFVAITKAFSSGVFAPNISPLIDHASFDAEVAALVEDNAGDPVGSISLSRNNGIASTYMRSDGTLPLSQSIAPTWNGRHIFDNRFAIGVVETFPNSDATPSVASGMWWRTAATTAPALITDFIGSATGDVIVVTGHPTGPNTIFDCTTDTILHCGGRATDNITLLPGESITWLARTASEWDIIGLSWNFETEFPLGSSYNPYNVLDYGATGDGTTDDAPAINLAVAAACASSGPRNIYLPGSVSGYRVGEQNDNRGFSGVRLTCSDIVFYGDGASSLLLPNTLDGNYAIYVCNSVTVSAKTCDVQIVNITIRDIKIKDDDNELHGHPYIIVNEVSLTGDPPEFDDAVTWSGGSGIIQSYDLGSDSKIRIHVLTGSFIAPENLSGPGWTTTASTLDAARTSEESHGIGASNIDGLLIRDVILEDISDEGIDMQLNSLNVVIDNLTATGCSRVGASGACIHIGDGSSALILGGLLEGGDGSAFGASKILSIATENASTPTAIFSVRIIGTRIVELDTDAASAVELGISVQAGTEAVYGIHIENVNIDMDNLLSRAIQSSGGEAGSIEVVNSDINGDVFFSTQHDVSFSGGRMFTSSASTTGYAFIDRIIGGRYEAQNVTLAVIALASEGSILSGATVIGVNKPSAGDCVSLAASGMVVSGITCPDGCGQATGGHCVAEGSGANHNTVVGNAFMNNQAGTGFLVGDTTLPAGFGCVQAAGRGAASQCDLNTVEN